MLTQSQYNQQLEEIKRKRAIADALQQRAIVPQGNMQNYSPIQALAQVLTGVAAKRKTSDLDKAQEALLSRQSADQQAEMSRILASAYPDAKPAQTFTDYPTMDGEQIPGLTATGPTKGEFNRDALLQAMITSQNPEFQKSGLTMLASENKPIEWKLGQIGAGGDKQQSIFYNPSDPSQVRAAGQPYSKRDGVTVNLSPAAQKELFEADEVTQASANVIDLLGKAKEINNKAYSGPLAKERAIATRVLPGNYEGADATIDLDNIMTGQALESLKAIFGGMPTEGERKILMEMQASSEKTPKQREAILDRAMDMAKRRLEFNKAKASSLRGGTYFKEAPKTQSAKPSGGIKFLGFE